MTSGSDTIVVREFIQRELETINAYQSMLARTENPEVRRMLAHAMEEEKEHVAEGLALLARLDAVQAAALATDHSAHFAPGGKGDLALLAFERGAAAAPREEPPRGGESAVDGGTAARGESTAHGDAPSRPSGFDAAGLTVGSLRGRSD